MGKKKVKNEGGGERSEDKMRGKMREKRFKIVMVFDP